MKMEVVISPKIHINKSHTLISPNISPIYLRGGVKSRVNKSKN